MGTWHRRTHFLHFGSQIISIFGESWNRRFKGTYFLVAHFMHFGGLKMIFLPRVKVVWALYWHFGGFRILFLLSRNTKFLRVPSFLWPHFLHFVGLKMRICWVVIHTASCEHFDGLKFLSMSIRKNHGSRVPRTVWARFRFFGGLKKPFLPSCVTCVVCFRVVSSLVSSCLVLSRHLSRL